MSQPDASRKEFIIISTDWHLTANPNDDYRWDIFPEIEAMHSSTLGTCKGLIMCGDLTDKKDNHPSSLVNELVDNLQDLANFFPVYILAGNHDYIDSDCPFFRFLNLIDENIHFIQTISTGRLALRGSVELLPIKSFEILFIPHIRHGIEYEVKKYLDVRGLDFKSFDLVFLHHTFQGAKASSGQELDGTSTKFFKQFDCPVYSGDIHVPQKLGPVEYIGSPYTVHFGDNYKPRMILLYADGSTVDYFPEDFVTKHTFTVTSPEALEKKIKELPKGDKVKVRLRVRKQDFGQWEQHKKQIVEMVNLYELDLHGVEVQQSKRKLLKKKEDIKSDVDLIKATPDKVLGRYIKQEKISKNLADIGLGILNEEVEIADKKPKRRAPKSLHRMVKKSH